jgi:hypothetical protein
LPYAIISPLFYAAAERAADACRDVMPRAELYAEMSYAYATPLKKRQKLAWLVSCQLPVRYAAAADASEPAPAAAKMPC